MKKYFRLLSALCFLAACSTPRNTGVQKDDGRIEINFVQVNDVYEIAPLSGGKEGGVARIATLKKNTSGKTQIVFW